jgi:hypothetical protein
MLTLLMLSPVMIVLSAFFIQGSLKKANGPITWRLITGGVLFIAGIVPFGPVTASGYLGPEVAVILGAITVLAALGCALWLALSLPRLRKLAALPMGLLLPAAIVGSIAIGESYSPERRSENGGDEIIHALDVYHSRHGTYPDELQRLEPEYLIIPTAIANRFGNGHKGWLYASYGDYYVLGFTSHVDRDAAFVHYYDSRTPGWNAGVWGWGNWGPLPTIPPTPPGCCN